MCTIITSGAPCQCSTRPARSPLVAILAAVGSAALVFAWWLTGPRIIGRRSTRPRRYARRVHSFGRVALVAVAVCAALWPIATGAAVAVAVPAAAAAAIVGRRRARVARARVQLDAAPREPLRVAVDTGWSARRHGERVSAPPQHTWYGAPTSVGENITPQRRNPR